MQQQANLFDVTDTIWQPTRHAALNQLHHFLPRAAKRYASSRNFDFGPDNRKNVSILSPWIRTRLITETEILSAVLSRHSLGASEKFVQEVFWRGYFKGWLEHRPQVWGDYLNSVQTLSNVDIAIATEGKTGIECFDHWAQELQETGYLHNHARMWFASIWIFTLNLPWQLGADFFLRHLLDGDPASNTLSWRWVAGLHTKGKHYIALPDNIQRYTDGRFTLPTELNIGALPMEEPKEYEKQSLTWPDTHKKAESWIITEEDCDLFSLAGDTRPKSIFALQHQEPGRSPLVQGFRNAAVLNAAEAAARHFDCELVVGPADDIPAWASGKTVATSLPPVGPIRTALGRLDAKIDYIARDYDRAVWPHATAGFFKVKKKIPTILSTLGIEYS